MPTGMEEVTQIMLSISSTSLPVMDGLAKTWAFSWEAQAHNIPQLYSFAHTYCFA